jgi:two-component SAPR family response regulator
VVRSDIWLDKPEMVQRLRTVLGGFADGHEEIGQIDFQITAVGGNLLLIDVQADCEFAHFELEGSDEAPEDRQSPLDLVARARRPKLKILNISGYSEKALRAGGTFRTDITVLAKPFSRSDLIDALDKMKA